MRAFDYLRKRWIIIIKGFKGLNKTILSNKKVEIIYFTFYILKIYNKISVFIQNEFVIKYFQMNILIQRLNIIAGCLKHQSF